MWMLYDPLIHLVFELGVIIIYPMGFFIVQQNDLPCFMGLLFLEPLVNIITSVGFYNPNCVVNYFKGNSSFGF